MVESSFPDGSSRALDENPKTDWYTVEKKAGSQVPHPAPQSVTVDLGAPATLSGFTYLPNPGRVSATVDQYQFYLSLDGKNWGKPVAQGEFSNIKASPIEQTVVFPKTQARYFRFVALHTLEPKEGVSVAELGVIGE